MKKIETLVEDMNDVLQLKGGWTEELSEWCAEELRTLLNERLMPRPDEKPRSGLRLSALGNPCKRELWYNVNEPDEDATLPANLRMLFLYGDILEIICIGLAKASGHRVEGTQTALEVDGIKGHRDCVIDGVTVDVKSASGRNFEKFSKGMLRSDDPFGYISQLSSYVHAGGDDVDPSRGAFLVVNKQNGQITLDEYDLTPEIEGKSEEIRNIKTTVGSPMPPDRLSDVVETHYKKPTGNRKLGPKCSYCALKEKCWPELQTYIHSGKPIFYTKIEGEPKGKKV